MCKVLPKKTLRTSKHDMKLYGISHQMMEHGNTVTLSVMVTYLVMVIHGAETASRPSFRQPTFIRPSHIRPNPIRPNPILPSPIRPNPILPNPIRPNPILSNPVRYNPFRPNPNWPSPSWPSLRLPNLIRPNPSWTKPSPSIARAHVTTAKPSTSEPHSSHGCAVSMNGGLPYPEPVIVEPMVESLDGFSFKRPELIGDEGKLSFSAGESVRLVCTGPKNHFPSLGEDVRDITVRCGSGDRFSYHNTQRPFHDYNCSGDSLSATQNVVSSSCSGNGRESIEIGFELNDREFVKIIDVCFDSVNLDVDWARFVLLSEIDRQETGFRRPKPFLDHAFPFRANSFYSRDTQRSTIENIIGREMANKYIELKGDSFFSRGHLVASSDFLYNIQKLATFNLINVAPQWFLFDKGNWNIAEVQTRFYSSANSLNLEVYTGIHGNEQLPDSEGELHNVYLNINNAGRKRIKAPAVFWKVLYEPKSKRAIVLVGINNQLKDWKTVMATPGVDLCQGKHQASEIWGICSASKPSDQEPGFGYCCEVKDIRNSVSFPKFTVNGLLQ